MKAGEKRGCSEIQREVAENAREMILSNLGKRYTIAEIARGLHVSPTQIKTSFRCVYGIPIYSFARTCRMQSAARLLIETDGSILEIAGKTGYENGSKFAKAFRDVMGASPREYRRGNAFNNHDTENDTGNVNDSN